MWIKYSTLFILFYFLALLQSSFFIHFSILGAFPNFVFALFFLLIFFEDSESFYPIFFWSITAGLFLDVFSFSYFGISVVILLILGFLIRKILYSLMERGNKHPLIYFIPIFLIFFAVYDVLSAVVLYFFEFRYFNFTANLNWTILIKAIYSLFFAVIGFFIAKLVKRVKFPGRQLEMF